MNATKGATEAGKVQSNGETGSLGFDVIVKDKLVPEIFKDVRDLFCLIIIICLRRVHEKIFRAIQS